MQLRALNLRVKEVPQYHANNLWEEDKRKEINVFSPDCSWFHVGSLSSGINGNLVHDNGWPLAYYHTKAKEEGKPIDIPNRPGNIHEKREYQRRLAFYRMAYEIFQNRIERSSIADFGEAYGRSLTRMTKHYNLDTGEIEAQKNAYRSILNI